MFPSSHIYWTFHWQVTGASDEGGQCGLRSTTPGTPPTLSTVGDVAAAFGTFWSTASNTMSLFQFYRVKAALITPAGTYDPLFDPVVVDVTPVNGEISGGDKMPIQTAHAVQLTTDRSSGPAHAGRVFLPAMGATLDTGWRWSSTHVTERCAGLAAFITAMNAATGESVQVMSQKGAGAARAVTGVRADRAPDTQRRRARQIPTSWSGVSPVS